MPFVCVTQSFLCLHFIVQFCSVLWDAATARALYFLVRARRQKSFLFSPRLKLRSLILNKSVTLLMKGLTSLH